MIWPHLLIVPILLPLIGAVLAAMLRGRSAGWVALAISLLTLSASIQLLHATYVGGPQVYRVGGWAPPYGIVLVADLFSSLLAVTSALVATASSFHPLASGEEVMRRRLYQPLFLLLLASLGGVLFTGDLFNLYVFMEMVILSSFALVAMADRPISAETTFKYAVLSALGSLLLLVGIALVYSVVGTLNMADIALRVRQGTDAPFLPIAAAMMLFAFLLKGAVFPFHFWQPDAHSAAPSSVSAMLSGILVKIGVYGITRMATLLFPESVVLSVLAPLGALSALFGGVAALANPNLKRMLAYSTIANMGFILLALGWGGQLGLTAAVVNAINHALIKGSLFLSAGFVVEHLGEQRMARLGGLTRLTPSGAVAFGLGVMALAGLPPLSGFLSKLTLFQAGLAIGDPVLLTVAAASSALGIAYSLRPFVLVFWGATPDWVIERWALHPNRPAIPLAPLLLVLVYVALGLWPSLLMVPAVAAATELTRPSVYIAAVLGGAK